LRNFCFKRVKKGRKRDYKKKNQVKKVDELELDGLEAPLRQFIFGAAGQPIVSPVNLRRRRRVN